MNSARISHSSCFLTGYLYVFCGELLGNNKLRSVERLKVEESESKQKEQAWQLICLKSTFNLSPRI